MITISMMRKALLIEKNIRLIDTYMGKNIEYLKIRDKDNHLFGVLEYDDNHCDELEEGDNDNIQFEIQLSWQHGDIGKMYQSLHLQEHHLDELIFEIVYAQQSLLNECELKLYRIVNSAQSLVQSIQKIDA